MSKALNNTDDARTGSELRDEFREAFNANAGYSLVDRDDIPYCHVSQDNTTSLINTDELESFGITELSDYEPVTGTLRPATVDGPEEVTDAYALSLDVDRAVYAASRIESISEFVGVDVSEFDLSVWSMAPSDVYLLRIEVPGTPWAIVLAPYLVGEDKAVTVDD